MKLLFWIWSYLNGGLCYVNSEPKFTNGSNGCCLIINPMHEGAHIREILINRIELLLLRVSHKYDLWYIYTTNWKMTDMLEKRRSQTYLNGRLWHLNVGISFTADMNINIDDYIE